MNRRNKKVKIRCLFVVEKCRMVILLYGLIIYFSYNIQKYRINIVSRPDQFGRLFLSFQSFYDCLYIPDIFLIQSFQILHKLPALLCG